MSCDGQRRDAEDFKERTLEIETGIAGHKMLKQSGYLFPRQLNWKRFVPFRLLTANHP